MLVGPANAPLQAKLTALLEAGGVPVRYKPSNDVDIAIVDLTGQSTDEEVRALFELAPRIGIVVVAPPIRAVDPKVLEVVAPEALETELLARVLRVRARLAPLNEAQQRQRDLQILLELTARSAE